MLRFLPAIFDESRNIRDAVILRTAHIPVMRKLGAPISYLRLVLVALCTRAYYRGEQLAIVAELRGLEFFSMYAHPPRLPPSRSDWRFLVMTIVSVGAAIALA
jgi:energy-coupling factor transporter transmembrane protein EcfT